jgi:hypothetical protein
VSSALRRLLRVRDLEQEQYKLALDSALGELRRLERALAASRAQERQGRERVAASTRSGELIDRIAGLAESEAARRRAKAIALRIPAAEAEAARRRHEFLAKRVEHRQAETLISETEAQDGVQTVRREQQSLDDWFGARAHRRDAAEPRAADQPPPRPTRKKL